MVFPQGTMIRVRHSRPILALSIRGSRRNEEYAGSGRCARDRPRNNAGRRADLEAVLETPASVAAVLRARLTRQIQRVRLPPGSRCAGGGAV
jgi:hypothetical protein